MTIDLHPPADPISPAELFGQRYGETHQLVPGELTDVIGLQLAHRSVRRYLPEAVTDEQVSTLVASAQSAATSSNLQLWSVVAVRDPERLAVLSGVTNDQRHVADAPVLLVWLVDLARSREIVADHDVPAEGADFLETVLVGFVDAALAAQNATLAAESLGLGTVYIGALRNDPLRVAEVLKLPQHVFAAFGLVVGRPDPTEGTRIKPRLPQSAVLHQETYRLEAQRPAVASYEERIGRFYAQEDLGHSWIGRVVARFGHVAGLGPRTRVRQALGDRGFGLR